MSATILALVNHYLPGYKSGGPVRTIANLVEAIGDEFDIKVVTADRDLGDRRTYPGVTVDAWSSLGKAQVYYASRRNQSFRGLTRLIHETDYDILYLNSFYNPTFTIQPLIARRAGLIPRKPTIIAPRGEFSEGAAAIKCWKKVPYRQLAFKAGLYDDLIWQASTQHEATDIRGSIKTFAPVIITADPLSAPHSFGEPEYVLGQVSRVAFLSRISPMKNLDYALQVLAQVTAPLVFDIYGPVGDKGYWHQCQELISRMPIQITVSYRGPVIPSEVIKVLSGYDLLFLPTRGENFGHVIAEALSAGTRVLVSDATPWRALEAEGVGWDIPLSTPEAFADKLEGLAEMSADEKLYVRNHVRDWATRRLYDPAIIEANRKMFLFALSDSR